jgi:hypothetical protein
MKKASRKLVLRSETVRTLANVDLARAIGGIDSAGFQRVAAAEADSGRTQCPAMPAVATAACG